LAGLSILSEGSCERRAPGATRNQQETSVRGTDLARGPRTTRWTTAAATLLRRIHHPPHQGSGLPTGALLIAAVSATALVPASTQALTWSIVPSPNVSPAKDANAFDAVSCVSATSCVATGYYYGRTKRGTPESALAETWNGTKWSAVPTPRQLRKALYGVSCTSARACVAVGASDLNPGYTQTQLEEFWNGTKWSIMPRIRDIASELLAVSCVSPAECTAVGDRTNLASGRSMTFIQSWNGRTWSTVPSPNAGSGDNFLSGVSCLSAAACTAVGVHYFGATGLGPLVESWNGRSWSIEPAPNKLGAGELNGVSCVSARDCVAAGDYLVAATGGYKSLIESWNGTRWSIDPVMEPRERPQSELYGVSCASATACRAAGTYWDKAFNAESFVESWNGSHWSIERTPNVSPGSTVNIMAGVSCASAAFCAAVGWHNNRTLAETGTRGG
jgi:hypothetical protein